MSIKYQQSVQNVLLFTSCLLGVLSVYGCSATQNQTAEDERSSFAGNNAARKANEKEAESCLRTKISNDYKENWAVRTTNSTTLQEGEHHVFQVILYAVNEYRIQGCGDKNAIDVDLVLYDEEGKEIARDDSVNREPILTVTPEKTATFYVLLHAVDVAGQDTAVAMAVTYR